MIIIKKNIITLKNTSKMFLNVTNFFILFYLSLFLIVLTIFIFILYLYMYTLLYYVSINYYFICYLIIMKFEYEITSTVICIH